MPIISVTLPSDNTSANVADYNVPITTILSTLNGGLDDDNIASLSGTKVTANTLPESSRTATSRLGWITGDLPAPNTVTALGNRQYSIVFNSVDVTSKIARNYKIRTNRTVSAPTQATSLNGTTQYWSKSSPNKMTFTNNFTITATVRITSIPTSSNRYIGGRADAAAANGFGIGIDTSGRFILVGINAGVGNTRIATSVRAIPLFKEIKLAATWSSGTILMYMDGVLIASTTATSGTAPTTIVNTGDFAVGRLGSVAAGTFFPGEVSQFAVYDAVLSNATILDLANQGIVGTESNLKSAYSFNGVATDLNTTTPNDLTNNGSATYVTGGGFGLNGASSSIDYGVIVTEPVFSTNTTIVVQVPEGCTIPTSGGISSIDYSVEDTPYKFPDRDKFMVETFIASQITLTAPTGSSWNALTGVLISCPSGRQRIGYNAQIGSDRAAAGRLDLAGTLSTTTSSETHPLLTSGIADGNGNIFNMGQISKEYIVDNASATVFNFLEYYDGVLGARTNAYFFGQFTLGRSIIYAIPAGL